MRHSEAEDTTGKSKITEAKARYKSLLTYFLIGLCIGMVVAERLYVKNSEEARPRKLVVALEESFRHHHLGGHSQTAAAAATTEHKPRNDLEAVLMKVAPQKEVLVAVANKNTLWDDMLGTFTKGIQRAGVKNHLILALDQETKSWCDQRGINAFRMDLEIAKAQQGTGDNHAVSAMKFGILKNFVELGWAVLLTDVDVCIFQNPFDHLYRDSDVEGMTDGFDERTAYGAIDGFDDPTMGWGRYAQYYKHFNMNSGLFYLLANNRTLDLLTRLAYRLAHEKYWDQTAYNEEIFFLSHGKYKSPQVSVRVMDIFEFMNSKVLFKDVRHRPKDQRPPLPVTVHINYHPDKHERMKAVVKYYLEGDELALDAFPGGSEPGTRR